MMLITVRIERFGLLQEVIAKMLHLSFFLSLFFMTFHDIHIIFTSNFYHSKGNKPTLIVVTKAFFCLSLISIWKPVQYIFYTGILPMTGTQFQIVALS